jgi:hypothetical protein
MKTAITPMNNGKPTQPARTSTSYIPILEMGDMLLLSDLVFYPQFNSSMLRGYGKGVTASQQRVTVPSHH